MQMNSENIGSKLKNYAPWIGLTMLTLLLMVFFKLSEQGYSKLQSQSENLIAKYAGNLSPLYVNSDLDDEDIFNFALYNHLPIDKTNKRVLTIESDLYGNDNYTIASTDTIPVTDNFALYKNRLGLTPNEEFRIDSILNGYKENLYSSIMLADENSVAIDPKISIIHKSIGADIYKFALDKKSHGTKKESHKNSAVDNREKLIAGLMNQSSDKPDDFIFITPDTVFSHKFKIDKKLLAENFKSYESLRVKGVNTPRSESKLVADAKPFIDQFTDISDADINFSFDSKNRKLTVPNAAFINTNLPNYDSLRLSLDNLADDLDNFRIALKSSKNGIKFLFEGSDGVKRENIEIDFNFEKLGEFLANTVSAATEASATDWDDFGAKMDSLSRTLTALEKDSTAFIKLKQVSEEIKKAKKEMTKKKNN